jgi:hypothetical protein
LPNPVQNHRDPVGRGQNEGIQTEQTQSDANRNDRWSDCHQTRNSTAHSQTGNPTNVNQNDHHRHGSQHLHRSTTDPWSDQS